MGHDTGRDQAFGVLIMAIFLGAKHTIQCWTVFILIYHFMHSNDWDI